MNGYEEILAKRVASVLGQELKQVQSTSFVSLMAQLVEVIEGDSIITKAQFQLAKENGIARKNVLQRYWDYGWEIERAITEPIRVWAKVETWNQWKETATKNGVCNSLYNARLRKGMTPEEAVTTPVKRRGKYGISNP